MLKLTHKTKILVANKPIDFRKGIDGIGYICQSKFSLNSKSGALFVFTNRSRTMVRILHYDGSGYWLCSKRLTKGRFNLFKQAKDNLVSWSSIELIKFLKLNY